MAEGHIYSKIMEFVNYSSGESSVYGLCSNDQHLRHFTDQFPHLTPQQIRTLTKAQEQKILEKTSTFRPDTLYQEIARVCPDARDIQTISAEEVSSRLNLYSTKLILTERPTCQSESEDSWEQSKSETFFGEVRFDMRLIDQQNENEKEQHGMRNIFEECDNHQCWNNTEYFGLS